MFLSAELVIKSRLNVAVDSHGLLDMVQDSNEKQ